MEKVLQEIVLASPRGWCAGVERAVTGVERVLNVFGATHVYHPIVHNHNVVEDLKRKGATFVEEINEVPDGSRVIFSAHGVSKAVREQTGRKNLIPIDATCPLVEKVHNIARKYHHKGYEIVFIGHRGHQEAIGTMGIIPPGSSPGIYLVETSKDIDELPIDPSASNIVHIEQTTLSVDDTQGVLERLKEKFPHVQDPPSECICYATTNRQLAVKQIASQVDLFIVVGSQSSSNSKRLVETARNEGLQESYLIDTYRDIKPDTLNNIERVGITSGASTPERLVSEVVEEVKKYGQSPRVREYAAIEEPETFVPLNISVKQLR